MQTELPFTALPPHCMSRRTDPPESHEAAHQITATGTRGHLTQQAIDLVHRMPGKTARELEKLNGLENGVVRKRLTDALHLGKVKKGPPRKCAFSGKSAATWVPS